MPFSALDVDHAGREVLQGIESLRGAKRSVAAPSVLRLRPPRTRLSPQMLAGLLVVGDGLALTLGLVGADLASAFQGASLPAAGLAALAIPVFLILCMVFEQYRATGAAPSWTRALLLWLGTSSLAAGAVLLADDQAEVGLLAVWVPLSAGLLMAFRAVIGWRIARWRAAGELVQRIAVLGASPAAAMLLSAASRDGASWGVAIVGVYDDVPATPVFEGFRVGQVADLMQDVALDRVDGVVIALPWAERHRMRALGARLRDFVVDVWLLPDPVTPPVPLAGTRLLPGVTLLSVWRRPLRDWAGAIKRGEDLVIGGLLLMVFLPVMALTAALVALDSRGPVLLRQPRFGYGNAVFHVFKFRTMYFNPEDLSGARPTVRGDKRVTRIGRFLRASSLDELPQLVNVLRGEMSLVGPRPHPVEMVVEGKYYEEVVDEYLARHRVRPGITGLAQINGLRGLVDTQEKARRRVALDLEYIDTWSLGLDLRILWKTLYKGFVSPGAF